MVRFWEFYVTLHQTRQVGPSGPQPIAISDMYALAQMRGLTDSDDLDFILYAIPRLDQEYLTAQYEEIEKKQKKAAAKPRTRPKVGGK